MMKILNRFFLLLSVLLAQSLVTAAPMVTPTPCKDDPDFRFKQERDKTCEWVAEKPLQRCEKEWKRIDLSYYCPRACDLCGPSPAPSTPPSGAPSTPPTAAPVTAAPSGCNPELCFNDPDFKHKACAKFDCDWVAKNPDSRCEKENVYSSCPESCTTSAFCLDVASKPGSKGCAGDNAVLCPISCGLCDLCPETSTRVSLRPLRLSRGGCPAPVEAPTTSNFVLCDWAGVGCQSRDETSLEYVNIALTGTIPSEIGELTALKEFIFFNNALTGTIPTEIGSLTALTYIYININELTGPIPSEIGGLTALERLILTSTDLNSPIPSEIGQLTAVGELQISQNALEGSIPSEIGYLTATTSFRLFNNDLTGPIPSEIGLLTVLEEFDFVGNNMSGTIPSEIGQLTLMTYLSFYTNGLEGTIPSEIGQMADLTALVGAFNNLSGSIPSEIGSMAALESLSFNDNALTGSIPSEIGNLNLQYCDLSNNQFDDTDNAPGICFPP